MGKNIFEVVTELLKTNLKYVSEDGKLLKAIVYCDVMNMNEELILLLLSEEKVKERFFLILMEYLFLISNDLLGLLSLKNFCRTHILDIQIKSG